MDDLTHARTIDRTLVHRAALAEVFLTSAVRRDEDTVDFGLQVPRRHAFYGDTLDLRATYSDPMIFLESGRQTVFVIAHEYLGMPRDTQFLLRQVTVTVTEPELLAVGTRPTDAVLTTRIRRCYRDRDGEPTGMDLRHTVLIDGREAVQSTLACSWVTPERWAEMRAGQRAEQGLDAEPAHCPPAPRAAPEMVGRRDPFNVVVSPLAPGREPGHTAGLVVDVGHPTMFDHPLDHLPGMLQIEGLRQSAVAAVAAEHGLSAADGALLHLSAKFTSFGEFDLPTHCHVGKPEVDVAPSGHCEATVPCTVRQGERTMVESEVRIGYVTGGEPAGAS